MQCPFLIEASNNFCETGTFGMIQVQNKDYKKYCSGRSYYLCEVYRANTGNGDHQKCLENISSRLIQA